MQYSWLARQVKRLAIFHAASNRSYYSENQNATHLSHSATIHLLLCIFSLSNVTNIYVWHECMKWQEYWTFQAKFLLRSPMGLVPELKLKWINCDSVVKNRPANQRTAHDPTGATNEYRSNIDKWSINRQATLQSQCVFIHQLRWPHKKRQRENNHMLPHCSIFRWFTITLLTYILRSHNPQGRL